MTLEAQETGTGQRATRTTALDSDASVIELGSESAGPEKPRQGRPRWLKAATKAVPQHLQAHVDLEYADIVFLICYLLSGICDSSAYKAWGCFVSMQTGNTIFLGLGASEPTPTLPSSFGWLKSLVSISSFCLGSFVFSAVTRHIGPRKRHALVSSFLVQCILIVIAAALLETNVIPSPNIPGKSKSGENRKGEEENGGSFLQLIPLALIAFQAAGQMAASRLLAFNEIPTTVLTSLYYDLASDPGILDPISENVKRNRRFMAVVGVVAGAVAGGWLARGTGGISIALWIAAGTKFGIACMWWFWRSERRSFSP